MANALPPDLSRLLDPAAPDREGAWQSFIATHHRLLLHVARSFAKEYDEAMDAFAFVLDHLREHDFRRLRTYTADGRTEFTTWLVVVARRSCLDWYRTRYGRDRGRAVSPGGMDDRGIRRRLVDLVGEDVETAEIPEMAARGPDARLRAAELTEALQAALSRLDPSDRLLVKLRFDDGLPAADIAEIMRLPTPFHVYRRVTHVLDVLRRVLRARGVEGPVP